MEKVRLGNNMSGDVALKCSQRKVSLFAGMKKKGESRG
jgi:hypothetical protein